MMGTTIRMSLFIKPVLLLLVGCFLVNNLLARENESRLRLSGELSKDINSKLNTSLSYEHRFNHNITVFDKAILEPSVSYDIFRGVRVGGSYRFILNQGRNSREMQFRGRAAAYVRYRYRLDDFVFKFRSQLQYGFDEITYAQYYFINELINRNYVQVEYRWFGTRITPFARYELFTHLNSPIGPVLNQWKLRGGANYNLTRSSRITLQYTYEHEFNVRRPMSAHVFAVGYRYSF